jgi:cytochrome c-type biogenesis protein CcmH
MTTFLWIAALLLLFSLAVLAWPLWRRLAVGPERARITLVLLGILVVASSVGLYRSWSNWSWAPAATELTPQNMVSRLARRLEKEPDDLEGWLMLGNAYAELEQYPLAVRAYQRATRVSGERNVEALTGLAESLILANQGDLAGRPGHLFEQALALDPNSVKALFYSAAAALERGDFPLAQGRFERLLAGNPPPEVRDLIANTLESLRQRMALQPAAPGAAAPAAAAPSAGPAASAQQGVAARIAVRIELDPAVAAQVKDGSPLFLSARKPGVRGPPLAAKRLDARFPQDTSLDATDAMMGGAGFQSGDTLELTARVSNQGGAIARSGDPFATATVTVGQSGRVTLRINTLTP